MLKTLKEIRGCTLLANDGEIGTVRDVFFDDEHWTTRYLVVNTSSWLLGRRVLLLPHALGEFDYFQRIIGVDLTRQEVKDCPSIDTDRPLTHDEEIRLRSHFGWRMSWGGVSEPPPTLSDAFTPEPQVPAKEDVPNSTHETHPRSARKLEGFRVQTLDGHLGHVEELLINSSDWRISYLLLKTTNWLPGKTVVVPTRAFRKTDWLYRTITADLTHDDILGSPEFDETLLNSEFYHKELQQYFDAHHHV